MSPADVFSTPDTHWTLEGLTAVYGEWATANHLPSVCANELLQASYPLDESTPPPIPLTPPQAAWLNAFIRAWDACETSHVAAVRTAAAP